MKFLSTLLSFILCTKICSAQFQFISPLPGATNLPVRHNIILREGSLINVSSIDTSLFTIKGSQSGTHPFHLVLCDDKKTMNLNPLQSFDYRETVTVSISEGAFSTTNGVAIPSYSFSFTTGSQLTPGQQLILSNADSLLNSTDRQLWPTTNTPYEHPRDSSGLFTINTNINPSPGKIFFDCRPIVGGPLTGHPVHCINIIDNSGDSIFQKMYNSNPYDFKLGDNGYFGTFSSDYMDYLVLDSNFHIVNTYSMANGFSEDPHELEMLANGYAFILGEEDQQVDDTSDQMIRGSVIQEFDPSGNVVFEWRSFDHIELGEAPHLILKGSLLDYVHTNSIEVDTDGNIITSHRHLDQVNKININTGEFIWRLGGEKNEFTFIDDPYKFNYQHDCRRLANGDITLYDDGNFHVPARSFAKEYRLDEINKTATLVWSYSHPDVNGVKAFYPAMGNVQRLPNGNTFIGWGQRSNLTLPSMTEVDPDGNIVWELTLSDENPYVAYRAHKYEWNPCARPSPDYLMSTSVTKNTARLVWEAVANPSQLYEIQYRRHIDSNWTGIKISSSNYYVDLANLDSATQYDWRIQSWCDTLNGIASHFTEIKTFTTLQSDISVNDNYFLTIYPNPANDAVIISCSNDISRLRLFNTLGQQLYHAEWSTEDHQLILLPVSKLSPGNYFVEVTSTVKRDVKMLVVAK